MGTTSRRHLRAALLGCIAALTCTSAGAQDAPFELAQLSTSTSTNSSGACVRGRRRANARQRRRARPRRRRLRRPTSRRRHRRASVRHRHRDDHHRRVDHRHHREEIERSPGQTIQDILAREPGVQVRSLFGGVNGAQTSVDMRGFGATAVNNTLILINGRRLNDLDLAGVDFSTIPRKSIERIEITRGNSGAVLYGDGAVGGVINIVTKTGVEPAAVGARAGELRLVRLPRRRRIGQRLTSVRLSATSAYGNAIGSDGYRENNVLRQQNGVGDLRYTGEQGSALSQALRRQPALGLPGGRLVTPTFSELDDRSARRRDAVRLRRQAGHQRHPRRHPRCWRPAPS